MHLWDSISRSGLKVKNALEPAVKFLPWGSTFVSLDDVLAFAQAVMLPALSPTDGNANFARIVGQVSTRWCLRTKVLRALVHVSRSVAYSSAPLRVHCVGTQEVFDTGDVDVFIQ